MRRYTLRPVAPLLGSLLIVALVSGCTLAGSGPAPLTPVGDTGVVTEEPTEETLPTPTQTGPIDVFGTQTAQAPSLTPTEQGGEIAITVTPTLTPTVTISATPAASGQCTHTVQPGENLFRIALRYGLTVDQLAAANGIANPAQIQVGTVLTIPGCAPTSGGTTPTGPTVTPAPGERTHTVQPGQNLYRIALQYGLTWQELAEYNNITNPNAIYVGQVIRIPPAN
jgi:LysM repeat protein